MTAVERQCGMPMPPSRPVGICASRASMSARNRSRSVTRPAACRRRRRARRRSPGGRPTARSRSTRSAVISGAVMRHLQVRAGVTSGVRCERRRRRYGCRADPVVGAVPGGGRRRRPRRRPVAGRPGPAPPAARKPARVESPAPTVLRTVIGRGPGVVLAGPVDQQGAAGAQADQDRADAAGTQLAGGHQHVAEGAQRAPDELGQLLVVGLDQVGTRPRPRRAAARPQVSTAIRRPAPPRPADQLGVEVVAHPGRQRPAADQPATRRRRASRPGAISDSTSAGGQHRAALVDLGGGAVRLDQGDVGAGRAGDRDGTVVMAA